MKGKRRNVRVFLPIRQVSISAHNKRVDVEDHVAGKDPNLDERRRRLAVIKRIIKSPKQQKGNDISTRVRMYDYRIIVNT